MNAKEHLANRIAALRAQAKSIRDNAGYCDRNADMQRELLLANETDRQANLLQLELDGMEDEA
jgi:hypothetical protein